MKQTDSNLLDDETMILTLTGTASCSKVAPRQNVQEHERKLSQQ